MLVSELAQRLAVHFEGDGSIEITGAAPLESAGAADLSFVGSARAMSAAKESAAGCLVVPKDYQNTAQHVVIRTDQPRGVFAAAVAAVAAGLGVERIDVRNATGGEDKDHPLRLGRIVRRLGHERPGRCWRGRPLREHLRQNARHQNRPADHRADHRPAGEGGSVHRMTRLMETDVCTCQSVVG